MLCLHLDAEPWGTPAHPVLVSVNHLHLLINGAYSTGELGFDDERFAMLLKLLNRTYSEELACSESVAAINGQGHRSPALPVFQFQCEKRG